MQALVFFRYPLPATHVCPRNMDSQSPNSARSETFWDVDPSAFSEASPAITDSRSRRPLSPSSRMTAERVYKDLAQELAESRASPTVSDSKFVEREDELGATTATNATESGASTIATLQAQLKVYMKKTEAGRRELTGLENEIARLKEQIEAGTVARGGFRAVQENAATVAKAEAIMDKRVAKAMVGALSLAACCIFIYCTVLSCVLAV
jgi:hypothetical protein